MQIKRKGAKHGLLIGLLLVVWSLPVVVRPLHIHHETCLAAASGEEEEHAATHDCHSCPLCCFALAPYIGAEAVELPAVLSSGFRLFHAAAMEGHTVIHSVPTLRGPPLT